MVVEWLMLDFVLEDWDSISCYVMMIAGPDTLSLLKPNLTELLRG